MTTYLAQARNLQSHQLPVQVSVLGWIRRKLEQHRQRAREQGEIAHLRRLEPYLLKDAGIDAASLHSTFARIMEAHPNFVIASRNHGECGQVNW
jgi:hypothetical protein